ncbi:MAG: hypothetical protein JWQ78_2306 [Sediminibacterium sp.]|nr:hypothetical protein [Sediminibacterium sp.]
MTDSDLKFREKRKWQLAYRRYVLEGSPSEAYAPYFGLDASTLRKWFELQFTEETGWDQFGKGWQFDHIIPATYFDYSNEEDLRLCWSFINMRVSKLDPDKARGNGIDILAVKSYFQRLYERTGFSLCLQILAKIETVEISHLECQPALEAFIIENKTQLETISSLTNEEFQLLNRGTPLADLLLEREILRKFGSGPKP